jgi:hypothetical protein
MPITQTRRRIVRRSRIQPGQNGRVRRWGVRRTSTESTHTQTFEQGYRVADASLDRYELYVGEDTPVDFDASGQPVATSVTLPFSWSPTPPGSGSSKDLHLVVRKRNAYGLVGFNVYETIKRIDSLGAEELGPVTAPLGVAVLDQETTYIRVIARYDSSEDENPADTWEVYLGWGSDPTPGVDSPIYSGSMVFIGSQAGLAILLGGSGYAPGSTAHVIVTAKRASDNERASAAVVQHVLAEVLDLSAGELFGGSAYEQR